MSERGRTVISPRPPRLSGFGLVELMISVALGLFLMLGLTTIFMSNKQSFLVMQRMGDLQENARLAALFLSRNIRHAGYHVDADDNPVTLFPTGVVEAVAGTGNGTGDDTVAGEVTITLYFQAEGELLNCQGARVGGPGAPATPAYAGNLYSLDTEDDELRCATRSFGDLTAAGAGGWIGSQPLISNVTAMAIRYGIDTNADGSVNRYVWANGVGNTNWDNVLSVRIALLLASDGAVKPVAGSETFDLLGREIDSPVDRLSRKVVELTIALPNRLHRIPL